MKKWIIRSRLKHIDYEKFFLLTISILFRMFICVSCNKEEPQNEYFVGIENISFENYPKVDGSTSSSILNTMVACKLLGLSYQWREPIIFTEWTLSPIYEEIPEQYKSFFWRTR